MNKTIVFNVQIGDVLMKKIIIIAVIAVALAAAAVLLTMGKNDVVSADVTMDISQVTVDKFSDQDDRDIAEKTDKEQRLSAMLSELDNINSAEVSISSDNSSVTAVLDISTELSQDETDAVLKLIMLSLDGIEKEDILITDQNSNVIYPLSE